MERILLALKLSDEIGALEMREQVKTIIFRYVLAYTARARIYTRNPLELPPVRYREWTEAQRSTAA